jgi:hypothetical protein
MKTTPEANTQNALQNLVAAMNVLLIPPSPPVTPLAKTPPPPTTPTTPPK